MTWNKPKQKEIQKKGKVLITLLFLLVFTAILAIEDYSDAEEHKRKTQELNQLADRFRAETGFQGEINPNSPLTHLTGFRGNFPDITFSADADSVTFRQACEKIVDRILPYTSANRSQLSMSRISKSVIGYTTEYCQQVGGYRVESRGLILITYDSGKSRFSISNGTVDLPTGNTIPVISYEDAVKIYDANVVDDKAIIRIRSRRPFLRLYYSDIYQEDENNTLSDYRLCWIGGYTKCIYIDALTGHVYRIVDNTLYD